MVANDTLTFIPGLECSCAAKPNCKDSEEYSPTLTVQEREENMGFAEQRSLSALKTNP